MSIAGRLYAGLDERSQRALVAIHRAVSKYLEALGGSPPRALEVGQDADTASEVLEDYDRAAESVSGPSLRTALGVDDPTPPLASWDEVTAVYRGASADVRAAVAAIRTAFDAARDISFAGRQLNSAAMRAYLARRGARSDVPRAPAPSSSSTPARVDPTRVRTRPVSRGPSTKESLAILLGLIFLGGRRRGRR